MTSIHQNKSSMGSGRVKRTETPWIKQPNHEIVHNKRFDRSIGSSEHVKKQLTGVVNSWNQTCDNQRSVSHSKWTTQTLSYSNFVSGTGIFHPSSTSSQVSQKPWKNRFQTHIQYQLTTATLRKKKVRRGQ